MTAGAFALQLLGVALLGFLAPALTAFLPLLACVAVMIVWLRPSKEVADKQVRASLWFVFVMPWFVAGFFAPYRAAFLVLVRLTGFTTGEDLMPLLHPSALDVPAAVGGLVLALSSGLYGTQVLRKQRDQLRLLPVSNAAAAAVGLVALRGVARRAHHRNPKVVETGDGAVFGPEALLFERRDWNGREIVVRRRWSRFYLEDSSGRIFVEPHGAEFDDGAMVWFLEPLRKIWLARRIVRKTLNPEPEERRELCDGDPVLVVGSAEIDGEAAPGAADAERLVVRPSSERMMTSRIERALFPAFLGNRWRFGRDYRHVFLLTDAPETGFEGLLDRRLRVTFVAALVWTSASVFLLTESLGALLRILDRW